MTREVVLNFFCILTGRPEVKGFDLKGLKIDEVAHITDTWCWWSGLHCTMQFYCALTSSLIPLLLYMHFSWHAPIITSGCRYGWSVTCSENVFMYQIHNKYCFWCACSLQVVNSLRINALHYNCQYWMGKTQCTCLLVLMSSGHAWNLMHWTNCTTIVCITGTHNNYTGVLSIKYDELCGFAMNAGTWHCHNVQN